MYRQSYSMRSGTAGPSKASATTQCQKCLKRGHYSYECKAVIQERPYVTRPSRTQQLANPKLVPSLTSDAPNNLMRKTGIADEQLAKMEEDRARKREREANDSDDAANKRRRSRSSSSVSTISTRSSRSRTRSPKDRSSIIIRRDGPDHRSRSPPNHEPASLNRETSNPEKKRRRESFASDYSSASEDDGSQDQRRSSRSTRLRYERRSPSLRGRRASDSKVDRSRADFSFNRRRLGGPRVRDVDGDGDRRSDRHASPKAAENLMLRQRSLSPFSRRLALTQALSADNGR